MFAEPITAFLIVGGIEIVILKCPGSAWPVNEMTMFIRFARPKSADTAFVPLPLPLGSINPTVVAKWCYELVTSRRASFGKLMISGQFETNFTEKHDDPPKFLPQSLLNYIVIAVSQRLSTKGVLDDDQGPLGLAT